MVWQFVDALLRVSKQAKFKDDDYADRLSHKYSVALCIVFTLLVGSGQFVGSPIACWAPAHFSGPMVNYANHICWIASTYYVPMNDTLYNPHQFAQKAEARINYYQWVPFILCLMAVCFYAPFAIWHVMAKPSGLDAKSVMRIINSMDQASSDSRDKTMRNTVKLIDRAIDYHRDYYDHNFLGRVRRRICRLLLPKNRSGYYITTLYVLIKLLYILNVVGQFFLLNNFMGKNYNLYGFEVIRDLVQGRDFWESPRFPRVTMCDFVIRNLGENNHRNTIQCVLPINLFNEKVFIFIWFWLAFVAAMSVYSFITWILSFTSTSRQSFIRRYLHVNDRLNEHHFNSNNNHSAVIDQKIFDAFLFEYLKQDGIFLLHIVKKSTNDIVTGELVCALWDNFKRYPRFMLRSKMDDSISKDPEKLGINAQIGDDNNGYHLRQ